MSATEETRVLTVFALLLIIEVVVKNDICIFIQYSAWGNPETAFRRDVKEAWASGHVNGVRNPWPQYVW